MRRWFSETWDNWFPEKEKANARSTKHTPKKEKEKKTSQPPPKENTPTIRPAPITLPRYVRRPLKSAMKKPGGPSKKQRDNFLWIQKLPEFSDPTDILKRMYRSTQCNDETSRVSRNSTILACHSLVCLMHYSENTLPKTFSYNEEVYRSLPMMRRVARYLTKEDLYIPPHEVFLLARKRPHFSATSLDKHFPWLAKKEPDKNSLLMKVKDSISKSILEKTDYGDGYISIKIQEEVKTLFFMAARGQQPEMSPCEKSVHFLGIEPAAQIPLSKLASQFNAHHVKAFFQKLIEKNRLPDFIELYIRYRNDTRKIREFTVINNIVRHNRLLPFWINLIERKDGLNAFHTKHVFQRHRLKNQANHEADLRHPFDTIGGEYCYLHAIARMQLPYKYIDVLSNLHKQHYTEAYKALGVGLNQYTPKTKKDSS